MTGIAEAAELLAKAKRSVALTGAGVSTESGIPDFRSAGGLWSRFDPMEYGTIGAFLDDPAKVWRMLAELLDIDKAEPNEGHLAMARLEDAGILHGVITQNIDGLHQKGGSRRVVEFHGSISTFTCLRCGANATLAHILEADMPPACPRCGALFKPDIVFFDEQIPLQAMRGAEELIAGADVMIVAGTSCQVAPASLLPPRFLSQGGGIIEINLEPTLSHLAAVSIADSFSSVMTAIADLLLQGRPL